MFPWEGDTDTYAGTYSNPRASYQSPRRARGKHRGNAVRKPSWIPNETLEILKSTCNPAKVTSTHKVRIVAQDRTMSYSDRLARFGAIGNVD